MLPMSVVIVMMIIMLLITINIVTHINIYD